jgi:hypothetical protein
MGRGAGLRPKYGRTTYEAKFRDPNDKTYGNGHKQAWGKIFSRHFEANNSDHAHSVANKIAKKLSVNVVSISKVSPERIIGNFNTWGLRDIIGKPVPERRRDVILDNVSLTDIVFNKNRK